MRFATELSFTEAYRRFQGAHPAIREAMCLRAQFPGYLRPMEDGDLLAGRIAWGAVGFSPQEAGYGYYCNSPALQQALGDPALSPGEAGAVRDMLAFWATESTEARTRAAFSPRLREALWPQDWQKEPAIAYPIYRQLGGFLDFDKLARLGLPGLKAEVARFRERTEDPEALQLYAGMDLALDLVADLCNWYAAQAEEQAAVAGATRRSDLLDAALALRYVSHSAPETFRQAMQLTWLYALVSGHRNYGRMDVYLGDFYARDIDNGVLTEAEALALTQSLWRLIRARRLIFDGRVVVGGMGRRNPENADRFALAAMEATRTVLESEPQLTLRWHKGMNPALMEKALTVIGEGRTYPMLYNDDVNVPAVAKAFAVPTDEAGHYMPYSCGEYVLDHRSYGSPNGVINLLKALEAALHNGKDPLTGRRIGLLTGELATLTTFDRLWEAYTQQVEFYAVVLAEFQVLTNRAAAEAGPFLLTALLYDDCIARGRGVFDGGVRYLGGTLETYGNINTADSLTAIRRLVYEEKRFTLDQLVAMLDAGFAGFPAERRLLQNAPKYGNDDPAADAMAAAVHEHVCNAVRAQRDRVDLDYYLVVVINNSANTVLGNLTAASADGRAAHEHMANANNPFGGADRSGVTAVLNSLVKLDPSLHAGAVQNLKLSRELFTGRRPQLEALLETYFEQGGSQTMITVVSRGDLEAALKDPDRYQHIFVRVGGFTARFVRMDRDVQMEVLSRTLH